MKNLKFPVTQHDLSKVSKAPINGQIHIDNLENLGFNTSLFLKYFRDQFPKLDKEKNNLTHFFLRKRNNKFYLTREMVSEGKPLRNSDFPKIPNAVEVPDALVENHFMGSLLFRIFHWAIKDNLELALKISVQFTRLTPSIQLNQLEGFNSFLIVNRKNIQGGHSKMMDNLGRNIIDYSFQPGEFIFQLKINEEGDSSPLLFHQMSLVEKENSDLDESWLDLILFRFEMTTRTTEDHFSIQNEASSSEVP